MFFFFFFFTIYVMVILLIQKYFAKQILQLYLWLRSLNPYVGLVVNLQESGKIFFFFWKRAKHFFKHKI
jgi:hypothetical protein